MEHVDRLLEILDAQIENYDALEALLELKRSAVERNDLLAVAEVAKQVEDVIGRNTALESERVDVAERVGASFGVAQQQPTLTQLVDRAPVHVRGPLTERRDRLRRALKTVSADARTIHDVLRLNFALVDRMLSTLLGVPSGGETYDFLGGRRKADVLRLIDQTA